MSKAKRPGGLPDSAMMEQAGGKRADDQQESRIQFGGFGGPPEYGADQQEPQDRKPVHDDQALRQRYQEFDSDGEDGDDDEDLDEDDFDEDEDWEDEEQLPGVGEYPTPVSLRQPGGAIMRDQPLFEGGPLISEVNSWKKQFEIEGHTVHLSEDVGGEHFIWRSLARTEYRDIMNLPNTDPLQREEIICEICVLLPYNYDFKTMASRKAGVPAVLAEHILGESGFKKPTPPQRL